MTFGLLPKIPKVPVSSFDWCQGLQDFLNPWTPVQAGVKLPIEELQSFSEVNMGPTRLTRRLLFDPVDKDMVWATIEIGGIFFKYGSW
jgi:hypothetical protein